MKTKLLIIIATSVVVVGFVLVRFQQEAHSPPLPNDQESGNSQNPLPNSEIAAVTGQVTCLPHKDTTGPQTLECAIGIKDDNGVYFALQSDDPNQITYLSNDSKIQVLGRFQEADPASKYSTAGTLHIVSLQKL